MFVPFCWRNASSSYKCTEREEKRQTAVLSTHPNAFPYECALVALLQSQLGGEMGDLSAEKQAQLTSLQAAALCMPRQELSW